MVNYETARAQFKNGSRIINSIDKTRGFFYSCVLNLLKLYEQGKVGSIQDLPKPENIKDFNRTRLDRLKDYLGEVYFPEQLGEEQLFVPFSKGVDIPPLYPWVLLYLNKDL
ncbi:MAG: hypothetical protein GTN76_10495 [Candidatus Aenigmarchaeota archaeon]|nr:hypothetical protein [Candidatus Aenigmarchaeota archaeon]NIP40508.1 hypothetical protein [Candidatus Aenigmarchaeota archaeon]